MTFPFVTRYDPYSTHSTVLMRSAIKCTISSKDMDQLDLLYAEMLAEASADDRDHAKYADP